MLDRTESFAVVEEPAGGGRIERRVYEPRSDGRWFVESQHWNGCHWVPDDRRVIADAWLDMPALDECPNCGKVGLPEQVGVCCVRTPPEES